jgi:hypothetical protein
MRYTKKVSFGLINDICPFYLDEHFTAFVRIKPKRRYRTFYRSLYKRRSVHSTRVEKLNRKFNRKKIK